MAIVVGLDGCKGGWIAAVAEDGALARVDFCPSARAAIEAYPNAEVFAFDIPIGLSADGAREADAAARAFLRPVGKASSVFPAPLQAVLGVDARSHATFRDAYAEARRVSLEASGGQRSIAAQSFALVPKIREVAEVAGDSRVYEAHPEVSFALMGDGIRLPGKKTPDGLMQRRALLAAHGLAIPELVGEASAKGAADDILDAVACAWTAGRIASGEARTFPDPPQRIDGREVAIWC